MKKALVSFLSKISFINKYYSGMATVFMLHRVYPFEKGRLLINEKMKVSPDFLENFILCAKSEGFKFISIDELSYILEKGIKVEKNIVITLDDGYRDNYTIAYPIFKKHKVPFTIYLTTSFPEKKAVLWWYILEDLVLNNEELIVGKKRYSCKTYIEKENTFLKVRNQILSLRQENLVEELRELFHEYDINWYAKANDLCMSWEEIRNLAEDELCTIGGHTVNHYSLNRLSKDKIIWEILEANERIEKEINRKVDHFAYPFGDKFTVGYREFQIVKELNFKTAVTTRFGNIYTVHRKYKNCCLPRIMLTENFDIKNIGKIRRRRIVTY